MVNNEGVAGYGLQFAVYSLQLWFAVCGCRDKGKPADSTITANHKPQTFGFVQKISPAVETAGLTIINGSD